jgi:electron transport complex protein RnfE
VNQPSATLIKTGNARETPLVFAVLGLCPLLAVTTSVANSIAISVIFFVVLIVSRLAISLIRKWTGPNTAIFALLTVSSTLTAAADIALNAFSPGLHNSLGIYLSLIAVNCIIISQPDATGSHDPGFVSSGSIIHTVKTGLGYIIIILIVGIAREVLGRGTMLSDTILGSGFRTSPASFFILPPGAFLVIAFIIAFINTHRGRRKEQNRGQI